MLAQFPIARAFGVDACGAVLCSGDRAPRHHQAATRLVARSIGRCTDGRGGFAQGGKQQPAAGRGGVGLPAEESTGDATAILGWPVRPVRPALSARRRPRHIKKAPQARRSRRGVAVVKGTRLVWPPVSVLGSRTPAGWWSAVGVCALAELQGAGPCCTRPGRGSIADAGAVRQNFRSKINRATTSSVQATK